MNTSSLAAAMTGAQIGSGRMALAAEMLRMKADAQASVAKLIDSAQQNLSNIANVAAGVGQNLDISV